MDILSRVARKISDGERLSDDDALALYQSADLAEIGRLADQVNRQKNGDAVYFNINRHINPTNICALSCKFCAYSRKPGEEGAYAYSIDEMIVKAGEAVAQGATEVHMVGGLHPRWKFDHYKEMIAGIRSAFPDLHIKAFTAVELDWFARKARKTIAEVLEELRAVGLNSLPGGGAEIFHPEIRDQICDTKVSAEQWIDTHRIAHSLDMHSNCTMLYGHIESYHHRVDHMRRLRDLQDETKGFNAFIPLSFQPFQNEMGIDRYTFGYDDLKNIAIARLYLDNFKHIKAYWIMLGQDIAQLALMFGANDLDGTVIEEKISRMAGGRSGMSLSRPRLEHMILKAKRQPVERDTLYRPVVRPDIVPTPVTYTQFDIDASREALNRISHDDDPSLEDLMTLAIRAPLHVLGQLAQARADRGSEPGSFVPVIEVLLTDSASLEGMMPRIEADLKAARDLHRMEPSTLALSFAAQGHDEVPHGLDVGHLVELIWALKHTFPGLDLALWGLKGVWRMAQDEGVHVSHILNRLKDAGLDMIESAPHETETDLTHGEIIELHQSVHTAGLSTTCKVELTAKAQGPSEPNWEAFLRRAMALNGLRRRELAGLSVEVSQGSFVTPAEYMRAVALARLAANRIGVIIAPLTRIPTLSPAQGIGTRFSQHPAEKFGALALHFGASDLGPIDVRLINPQATIDQIRSTGFRPSVRDSSLARSQKNDDSSFPIGDLRHVPSLSTHL